MASSYHILIADDDCQILKPYLTTVLADLKNHAFHYASSAQQCRNMVSVAKFDLVFLDINFGPNEESGIDLLPAILSSNNQIKVCMLSGDDSQDTLLKCMRLGAADFICKNGYELPKIVSGIRQFIEQEKADISDVVRGRELAKKIGIVSYSKKMDDVFSKIMMARDNANVHVLIVGETGTGKEKIMEAIAHESKRPFAAVDCSTIPESLADSILFGHDRGAFTGAGISKVGYFRAAHGGDLFLDEIGNLPYEVQVKFLRAIQEKEITPVGATKPIAASVRLIAATNSSLTDMTTQGTFRNDLYTRLNCILINVPPLRERLEDIEPLIDYFLKKSGKPNLAIAGNCLNLLKSYRWEGNIRELSNVVTFMANLCRTDEITLAHLPQDFKRKILKELNPDIQTAMQPHAEVFSLPLIGTMEQAVDNFYKAFLPVRIKALGELASKRSVAKNLNISRVTLRSYLSKYDLKFLEETEE